MPYVGTDLYIEYDFHGWSIAGLRQKMYKFRCKPLKEGDKLFFQDYTPSPAAD